MNANWLRSDGKRWKCKEVRLDIDRNSSKSASIWSSSDHATALHSLTLTAIDISLKPPFSVSICQYLPPEPQSTHVSLCQYLPNPSLNTMIQISWHEFGTIVVNSKIMTKILYQKLFITFSESKPWSAEADFWHGENIDHRSQGALHRPRLLVGGPSGRLWALHHLRACLTSSFAPFGRSGRVTHAKLY